MHGLLVIGLSLVGWAQAATPPPIKTLVVLGAGPAVEAKEQPNAEPKEPASTPPMTLEERLEKLQEEGYATRRDGPVAYAYSAGLWPAAGLASMLKSVRFLAGRLGPDGILRLDGPSEFVTRLNSEWEYAQGFVIEPTTALALESDQEIEVTNGDRTIVYRMRSHRLPESARATLAARPARQSTKTIQERLQMRPEPALMVSMLPVKSVTVKVYGDGWDDAPRRLELVGKGMALMADELAAFRGQYAAGYDDLERTMAAHGLAPGGDLPHQGPFSSLTDDLQAKLRMMAKGRRGQDGFATDAEAAAFVEGATMVRSRLRIVLKAYAPGPEGKPIAIGIQLTPP